MDTQLINTIFGMKIRQARTEAGLTLSKFASASGLSPSYATEVEKGRKYPRADKIMRMAEVLDRTYDELVSIQLDPSLGYLEAALSSPMLRQFPFEEFGMGMDDFVQILTREPVKASALLHAIIDIGRRYDLSSRDFLRAALRSYQELNDNYFQEIEDAAEAFSAQHELDQALPITLAQLEEILRERFGFAIEDGFRAQNDLLARYRSIFVRGPQPRLLLNPELTNVQRRFCIARELGYLVLGLSERALTSPPDAATSFAQMLNDFRASYFAGALMMPRESIFADIEGFFAQTTWQSRHLLDILHKYDATPEALLYRFSEIIPQFVGPRVHFIRMQQATSESGARRYKLYKQLNMNQLLTPSGLALSEHFCRRWLAARLLRELDKPNQRNEPAAEHMEHVGDGLIVGVQISEFLDSRERFLCFGFGRPSPLLPDVNDSMIVGFRMEPGLAETIRFANDPAIPFTTINETCERCPLTADQCLVRATPPTVLEQQTTEQQRKQALNQLVAQLRTLE